MQEVPTHAVWELQEEGPIHAWVAALLLAMTPGPVADMTDVEEAVVLGRPTDPATGTSRATEEVQIEASSVDPTEFRLVCLAADLRWCPSAW